MLSLIMDFMFTRLTMDFKFCASDAYGVEGTKQG